MSKQLNDLDTFVAHVTVTNEDIAKAVDKCRMTIFRSENCPVSVALRRAGFYNVSTGTVHVHVTMNGNEYMSEKSEALYRLTKAFDSDRPITGQVDLTFKRVRP